MKLRRVHFIWMIVAVAFSTMMLSPIPEGLSVEGWRAITIFIVVIMLWITEVIPLPAAALLGVVLQPIMGVASAITSISAFGSTSVFLILSGFLLGAGIVKSGLDKRAAYFVLKKTDSSGKALMGIIIVTALLSMLISNTATVLLMVPIVLTLTAKADLNEKPFLLATCYAANIGGVGLLVGTPPNVMAADILGMNFLDWAVIGLPFVVLMIPLLYISLVFMFHPHQKITKKTLDKLEDLGNMGTKEKLCASIIIITLLLWVTSPIHGISSVVVGILGGTMMMVLVSGWKFFQSHTNWGVIFLIGGAVSISNALVSTGAAAWIGRGFLSYIGFMPPFIIVFLFAAFAMGITQFIQNTATAGMMIPILYSISHEMGMVSGALVIIPVIAVSMTFLTPPGTAPNAIVHGTGKISVREMARAGILPTLFSLVVLMLFSILV